MNLKTVSVTYERKQNLGDFSSATIGCTLWADMEPGDDEAAVMTALWGMAKTNVKAQLLPLTGKTGSMQVREFYLGLPITDLEAALTPATAQESESCPSSD